MTFDVKSNSPCVLQKENKAIWKENLAVCQKSLTLRDIFTGNPSFIIYLSSFHWM